MHKTSSIAVFFILFLLCHYQYACGASFAGYPFTYTAAKEDVRQNEIRPRVQIVLYLINRTAVQNCLESVSRKKSNDVS